MSRENALSAGDRLGSARPPAGIQHARTTTPSSEAVLVHQVLANIGVLHQQDATRPVVACRREVSVGRTVADIVSILAAQGAAPSVPTTALTVLESVVLATLRRHGATRIDLLERRCGLVARTLRGSKLSRLHATGIVTRSPGGRIALARPWTTHFRVIAIEAKLTKWREALAQAVLYRRYADWVYVALPEGLATMALLSQDLFEAAGVGLLLVRSDRLSIALLPSNNSDHDWRREFVLSRLLRPQACPPT